MNSGRPFDLTPFSADTYRAVMRHWPSGVTVITMLDGERPHGMTASAFTSVSVSPPLILIVVDQRWRSHGFLRQAGVFCISLLGAQQEAHSDRFAGRQGAHEDRFAGLRTKVAANGVPYLADATAYLACVVTGHYEAGDHTIFVGQVTDGGVLRTGADPLVFYNTAYRRLAPESTSP